MSSICFSKKSKVKERILILGSSDKFIPDNRFCQRTGIFRRKCHGKVVFKLLQYLGNKRAHQGCCQERIIRRAGAGGRCVKSAGKVSNCRSRSLSPDNIFLNSRGICCGKIPLPSDRVYMTQSAPNIPCRHVSFYNGSRSEAGRSTS